MTSCDPTSSGRVVRRGFPGRDEFDEAAGAFVEGGAFVVGVGGEVGGSEEVALAFATVRPCPSEMIFGAARRSVKHAHKLVESVLVGITVSH